MNHIKTAMGFLLLLQLFAFSAGAQTRDNPENDIFGPEMYQHHMDDLNLTMEMDIYKVDAPIQQATDFQEMLIDSIAAAFSLPSYLEMFNTIVGELECSNTLEAEPEKAALICEDKYCEKCSRHRQEFYNYLKTKVFMSERAKQSVEFLPAQ